MFTGRGRYALSTCWSKTGLLGSTVMGETGFKSESTAVQDEAALLARLQAGDEDAFATCVRTYIGRLLVVARRILSNEEDARDAVQDAFLSAFKEIGHFEGRSLLGTWLHRIVVNAALYRLRSRQRHPEQSIEDLLPHFTEGEHQIEPPVPWKRSTETTLERQESCALVRRCIDQLAGKLPYRFAAPRHRRIGHGGNSSAARHQSGCSQDSLAPRPPGPTLSPRPAFSGRRRMNCREFTEFLHEYLFGNLPAAERAEFEKHLAECPWCVAYLDSYRKTIQLEQAAFAASRRRTAASRRARRVDPSHSSRPQPLGVSCGSRSLPSCPPGFSCNLSPWPPSKKI